MTSVLPKDFCIFFTSSSAINYTSHLIVIKFLFDVSKEKRKQSAEHQIEHSRVKQRPDKTLCRKFFRDLYYLDYRYNAHKRGVFYQGDYLVAHGRNNSLYNLHKHDLKENLAFCHAKYLARLVLASRDTLDTATVNFRKIARIVYNKGYERRKKTALRKNRRAKNQTGRIKHDQYLQH